MHSSAWASAACASAAGLYLDLCRVTLALGSRAIVSRAAERYVCVFAAARVWRDLVPCLVYVSITNLDGRRQQCLNPSVYRRRDA